MVERHRFRIEATDAGARLDRVVAKLEPSLSRAHIQRLIAAGDVLVNGTPAKASRKLREADDVELVVRPPEPVMTLAENIELDIVFEDEHLIVINKQPGMVVHPAPGHSSGTLVNALLGHCSDLSGVGGELRPGIVHRIDKDTSGIIVATKDDRTHHALADMFKDKVPFREYIAVVSPPPSVESKTLETLYGRHPVHRKRFSSKVERGKTASTRFEVDERFGDVAAVVRCRLATGRTHQIRVHMSDYGCPLIGDPMYGRRYRGQLGEWSKELGRQALHAARLEFRHPITGQELAFASELPDDMVTLIRRLRRG